MDISGDGFLAGRAAIITGGLTGQGLAIAGALAGSGANVAVGSLIVSEATRRADAAHYPSPELAEQAAAALRSHGTLVLAGNLDVRSETSVADFVRRAEQLGGPTDILVNAAGTTAEHPVCGHPDHLWDRIIETNLTGAFRMIRQCLAGMIERNWGRIVNIGSTAATSGWQDNPAYCASKAGLLGLTRCVALEGAPHGVACAMISPSWVETELMRRDAAQIAEREGRGRSADDVIADIAADNPQRRIIQTGEIAAMAAHLCREESFGITGDEVRITGGAHW